MKILRSDFKKGFVHLEIDDVDDLFVLNKILDKGDFIKGKTTRKIKLGDGGNAKIVKKTLTLKICVEKVEFGKGRDVLRVLGTIAEDSEDVPKGSHQSLNLEVWSQFSLEKEFLDFQIEELREVSKEKTSKILLVVLERDNASFALLKRYGYLYLGDLFGEQEKKYVKEQISKDFYGEVVKVLKGYVGKYSVETIILGSPAFWKDELKGKMDASLVKKTIFASCHSGGKNGLHELLSREEVQVALKDERITKEIQLIHTLLVEIGKDGLGVYGFSDVREASLQGAVKSLLVSDRCIQERREKDTFYELEEIMKTVSSLQGEVHIIHSDFDAGQKLDGLGGIGALLRYAV